MNRIYRVVYNAHTQTHQAVSEHGKGRHKTQSCSTQNGTTVSAPARIRVPFLPTAIIGALLAFTGISTAQAAPQGGEVVRGAATISQQGKLTDIHQTTPKAAINWQKFGIKHDETVQFRQPDTRSIMLNRVIGNERSVIDGALRANGKVFVLNPHGTLIGNGAKINVGGLIVSSANISDQDFMAGKYRFHNGKGNITNLGNISVPEGGTVALIAPIVNNQGKINTPKGNAILASAKAFTLTFAGDNFSYTLDQGTLQGLVDNGGAILADGGHIVLTAKGTDSIKKSLIKHSGIAQANTVKNQNGVIELLGDLDNTRLAVSGSLKAEAPNSGDGGFIETSAATLNISDAAQISTQAQLGKTGTWLIDPKDFTVAPTGGDITGVKVSQDLQSNNIQLKSREGAKEGKGDIIINDEINWNKNKLTLTADNDILINKNLNGTGTASLSLEYGQAKADGKGNDYHLQKDVPVYERTVSINLPEGETFSTKKGRAGSTNKFNVIHQMPEITGDKENGFSAVFKNKNIALGRNIDISHTADYEGFLGWKLSHEFPVVTKFHGLGHTVQNLTLKSPSSSGHVGLLQYAHGTEIRDIGVTDIAIAESASPNTGGLVGVLGSFGSIKDSYATGNIHSHFGNVGLLAGQTGANTQIINSYSSGSIGGFASIGGLVGENAGDISYSTSSAAVQSSRGTTGGLVGQNSGKISHSHASGSISSSDDAIGGLVGFNSGVIEYSHATGNVHGDSEVGGLVGMNGETIRHSHAVGKVSASNRAGGLVGANHVSALITNSHATGEVFTASNYAGGLVGQLSGHLNNSYTTSDVRTQYGGIGGLVGILVDGEIVNSYSSSNIDGKHSVGGLVGAIDYSSQKSSIKNSHFLGKIDPARVTQDSNNTIGALIGYKAPFQVDNFKLNIENSSYVRSDLNIIGTDEQPEQTTINNVSAKALSDYSQPNTYQGWDFEKVWQMENGNTPSLRPPVHTAKPTPSSPTLPGGETPQTSPAIDAVQLQKIHNALGDAQQTRTNMLSKLMTLAKNGKSADISELNRTIQNQINATKALINALPDGQQKTNLLNELAKITLLTEKEINEAKKLVQQKDKERLEKEKETTANQEKLKKADSALKDAQQTRTNMLNKLMILAKNGKSADISELNRTIQNQINATKALINALPDGQQKTNLLNELAKITLLTEKEINEAKKLVQQKDKERLEKEKETTANQEKLKKANNSLENTKKVLNFLLKNLKSEAEKGTLADINERNLNIQNHINATKALINALPDGQQKTNLLNELAKITLLTEKEINEAKKLVQQKDKERLEKEKETANQEKLKKANNSLENTKKVLNFLLKNLKSEAEKGKLADIDERNLNIQNHINATKALINALPDGQQKTNLLNELAKITLLTEKEINEAKKLVQQKDKERLEKEKETANQEKLKKADSALKDVQKLQNKLNSHETTTNPVSSKSTTEIKLATKGCSALCSESVREKISNILPNKFKTKLNNSQELAVIELGLKTISGEQPAPYKPGFNDIDGSTGKKLANSIATIADFENTAQISRNQYMQDYFKGIKFSDMQSNSISLYDYLETTISFKTKLNSYTKSKDIANQFNSTIDNYQLSSTSLHSIKQANELDSQLLTTKPPKEGFWKIFTKTGEEGLRQLGDVLSFGASGGKFLIAATTGTDIDQGSKNLTKASIYLNEKYIKKATNLKKAIEIYDLTTSIYGRVQDTMLNGFKFSNEDTKIAFKLLELLGDSVSEENKKNINIKMLGKAGTIAQLSQSIHELNNAISDVDKIPSELLGNSKEAILNNLSAQRAAVMVDILQYGVNFLVDKFPPNRGLTSAKYGLESIKKGYAIFATTKMRDVDQQLFHHAQLMKTKDPVLKSLLNKRVEAFMVISEDIGQTEMNKQKKY